MTTFNGDKRPVLVHKSADRNKFKPKPWSHQQDLAGMRGQNVRLETELGSFEGRLIEADQFAVKMNITGTPDASDYDQVFFKHAIFSFNRF